MGSPEELRRSKETNFLENRERPLNGKVALVTGGSRDIGAGIVEEIASNGGSVLSIHRDERKHKRALQVIERVRNRYDTHVEFLVGDIVQPETWKSLHQALEQSFGGKLDYLILSASGKGRDINVDAANGLVGEFLPIIKRGGKIVLIQSIPGRFYNQLKDLGKISDFYKPIAEAKHEGEQSLRQRIKPFQEYGVSLVVVCPPEVSDTSNMMVFRRYDPTVSDKHKELSQMLGIPTSVTIQEVSEKVVEVLGRDDIAQGHVELFGDAKDSRSILSQWYGDNAIFVDTLEMVDENHGIGRMIVTKEYTKGHFNENVGEDVLPGHLMAEAAAQTAGLVYLGGEIDVNSMPLLQGYTIILTKVAKPGDGLKIYAEITERTKRGLVGNAIVANMQDEQVAEVTGLKALVVNRDVAKRLLRG